METIIFDENCTGWTNNFEDNRRHLAKLRSHLNDLLISQGYVYKRHIHEVLGANWDPRNEVVCYRREDGFIDMRFKPMDNGAVLVEIH